MDAPTFEWQDDVLVTKLGDNWCVAFRPPVGRVEKAVEMAACALWAKEHEGWLPPPFTLLDPPPDEELLAYGELIEAYTSDREGYIAEAREAYREFAGLTT